MVKAIRSFQTSVLTRATRHHIPGDDILRSHRCEAPNLTDEMMFICGEAGRKDEEVAVVYYCYMFLSQYRYEAFERDFIWGHFGSRGRMWQ
jgi:hypothetical protein